MKPEVSLMALPSQETAGVGELLAFFLTLLPQPHSAREEVRDWLVMSAMEWAGRVMSHLSDIFNPAIIMQ